MLPTEFKEFAKQADKAGCDSTCYSRVGGYCDCGNVDPDLHDALQDFEYNENQFLAAKNDRNASLARLQEICSHQVIYEHKGGYGYSAGGIRTCVICGKGENQPVATPGDEYDFATYGSYKILTGKTQIAEYSEVIKLRKSKF